MELPFHAMEYNMTSPANKILRGLEPISYSSLPSWEIFQKTGELVFWTQLEAEAKEKIEADTRTFEEGLSLILRAYAYQLKDKSKSAPFMCFHLPTVDLTPFKTVLDGTTLRYMSKFACERDSVRRSMEYLCKALLNISPEYKGLVKLIRSNYKELPS